MEGQPACRPRAYRQAAGGEGYRLKPGPPALAGRSLQRPAPGCAPTSVGPPSRMGVAA
ncbi:MAG: hypothetical protein QXH81_10740 [Thermofilaceae archaeon]